MKNNKMAFYYKIDTNKWFGSIYTTNDLGKDKQPPMHLVNNPQTQWPSILKVTTRN